MKSKPHGFGNVSFWIRFLIELLILLNLIVFKIYQEAHQSEFFLFQLWEYFESGVFKVITVSLILPILLFLLESHFKIIEDIKKNRFERARQDKEERRERRLEGIKLTLQMWNQIYNLTSEVRHFHKNTEEDSGIKDILQRLLNFSNSAEDIVNILYFRFNLSEEIALFLVFVNILLSSAETVAYSIGESDNMEECVELQNSLGVVQGGIKTIAHHSIISILKHYMELLELKENRVSLGREQAIQSTIEAELKSLRNWALALKRDEIENNKILPTIEGEEVEDFRGAAKKFEDWLLKYPRKAHEEYSQFSNLYDLFCKIPHEKLVYAGNIPYSKEYVRHLADWLSFESVCQEVTQNVKYQKEVNLDI